jgi:hypothetical protein
LWIKDFNVRHETCIGKNREHPGPHRHRTEKDWQMGLYVTKKLLHSRVTRLKRQPAEWEKIFASITSDKGLVIRIYRELKKLILQRINNPLNK